jgi:tetratricopeptide (TPR) repeat protein
VQASRARKAEALVVARLADAEQISQFLQEIFRSPDPANDGRMITVAESLDRAAKRLETDLADQPERRAKLQTALAATYASLGLNSPALQLRQKVHDYWLAKAGPDASETLTAATELSYSLYETGQRKKALPMTEDLVVRTRRRYGPEHTNTIRLMGHYATVIDGLGRTTEALKLREENLAAHRKVFGPEHRNTLGALGNLEVTYSKLGQKEKARPLQEEVVALSRKVLGAEHPETLRHVANLGVDYLDGRLPEAIELLEEVVGKQRRVLGPEHPSTIHTLQTLGTAYHQSGRINEGLRLREQVLELTRKILGPEHPHILHRMSVLANSYRAVGQTNEASRLGQETLALSRKIRGEEHPDYLQTMEWLAYFHFQAQHFDEAIRLGEDCVGRSRKIIDTNSPAFMQRVRSLGNYYASAGRLEEAIPLRRELVVLTRQKEGPEHGATVEAIKAVADLYAEQGRWAEARVELLPLIDMKQLSSASTIALMALAALDVLLGERTDYETHCKAMLARFGSVTNSEAANRLAKACLLLPGERKLAIELAARGVQLGQNSPTLNWYLLAQALAQYRSEDWSGSVASGERALELSKDSPNHSRNVALHAILSMARHRLGQVAEAHTSQAEAEKLSDENWPSINEGKLGSSWHDVLIAHLLTREAKALSKGHAQPVLP